MGQLIKNFLLVLLLSISGLSLSAQQQTVGVFHNSAEAFDGYTLFTSLNNKGIFLIDNCGQVINQWGDDKTATNAVYLLENGDLLRIVKSDSVDSDIFIGGGGESAQILDWNGNVVWEYRYVNDSVRMHHDIEYLPNGNVLILAWEQRSAQVAIDAGRDPALLSATDIYPEHLIEVRPIGADSGEVVWEWHVWDHLVQDFDPSKPNFAAVASHPELFDLNFVNMHMPESQRNGKDWTHANGVSYNPELDQIALSFQRWSEIIIIDHSTTTVEAAGHTGGQYGKGGDILYRWGNPIACQLGDSASQRSWGQHDIQWIPEGSPGAGKLLFFNNGIWRSPGYSEVLMLDPPQSASGVYMQEPGKPFGPEEPEVVYGGSDHTSFYSWFISGVQRLPNGNTLITEGETGTLFEINPEEEEVWKYVNPQGSSLISGIVSQGDPLQITSLSQENATFKAIRYPVTYAAFSGRNLTPGPPVEMNPWDLDCRFWPEGGIKLTISPNPATRRIVLSLEGGMNERLRIYNLMGQIVYEGDLGPEPLVIDGFSWEAGVYTVLLENGQFRKLLLQN